MSFVTPINLGPTLGALLFGTLFDSIGYGIIITQAYQYFSRFTDDQRWIKYTVLILLCLETLQLSFCWHFTYYFLILHFGSTDFVPLWSLELSVTANSLVTLVVNFFYARRIHILAKQKWLMPSLAMSLSLTRTVMDLLVTGVALSRPQFGSETITHWTIVSLSTGAAADIFITTSLIYLLYGSRTGTEKPDNLIDKLIYWTASTGLLTSIYSIVILITLVSMDNLIFAGMLSVLSKVYSNSLIAALHYRTRLQRHNNPQPVNTVRLSTFAVENPSSSFPISSAPPGASDSEGKVMEDAVVVTSEFTKDMSTISATREGSRFVSL